MKNEIRTGVLKKGLCKVCGVFKSHRQILIKSDNFRIGVHYWERWECTACQTRVKILKERR